jgi:hypothetical protein
LTLIGYTFVQRELALRADSGQRSLGSLLQRQYPADQPDHQHLEQKNKASDEYLDEQLFHGRKVRSRR